MKFRSPLVIAVLIVAICCKPAGDSDSTADSLIVESDTLQAAPDENAGEETATRPKITYYWQDQYNDANMFTPMQKLYAEVQAAWKIRDSLYFAHEGGNFTASDSVLFKPGIDAAYQSILRYAEEIKAGVNIRKTKRPDRPNSIGEEDESFGILPETTSTTLNNADFMFLGGAPFFEIDPEVQKDVAGNPEVFYTTQMADNSVFFFEYVYSRNPSGIELSYGPPLNTYEQTDAEINGIGSITHNLKDRIPVWFLTRDGAVAASLLSVNIRLGSEYGCVSNDPTYGFACSKNLDPADIFGVFASDNNMPLSKANTKPSDNENLWEYDLDGDGQADLVQVAGVSYGASGDLTIAIWYVRVKGEWVVLDYASQPDCT